jgi:hypothetical protein
MRNTDPNRVENMAASMACVVAPVSRNNIVA